jgi:hypothetical protein
MTSDVIVDRLRRFLLLLAALALLTTLTELWLVEHTQEALQWLPIVLCGSGIVSIVAALVRPQPGTLIALRVVMSIVALGGLIGIGVHLLKNLEFEQEIRPNTAAGALLMNALKGAAPFLAPGALVFAALLALAATYRDPRLESAEQVSRRSMPQDIS